MIVLHRERALHKPHTALGRNDRPLTMARIKKAISCCARPSLASSNQSACSTGSTPAALGEGALVRKKPILRYIVTEAVIPGRRDTAQETMTPTKPGFAGFASKLVAPDFDHVALTPWPKASPASSGTSSHLRAFIHLAAHASSGLSKAHVFGRNWPNRYSEFGNFTPQNVRQFDKVRHNN